MVQLITNTIGNFVPWFVQTRKVSSKVSWQGPGLSKGALAGALVSERKALVTCTVRWDQGWLWGFGCKTEGSLPSCPPVVGGGLPCGHGCWPCGLQSGEAASWESCFIRSCWATSSGSRQARHLVCLFIHLEITKPLLCARSSHGPSIKTLLSSPLPSFLEKS